MLQRAILIIQIIAAVAFIVMCFLWLTDDIRALEPFIMLSALVTVVGGQLRRKIRESQATSPGVPDA